MYWIRFALTVLASGFVASLTDWLFMGDWLYKRYNRYPEIWRHPHAEGEGKAIAWAAPFPFLTCAVFCRLVRSPESSVLRGDPQVGGSDLAYRTIASTRGEWTIHQGAFRNHCVVLARLVSEIAYSRDGVSFVILLR